MSCIIKSVVKSHGILGEDVRKEADWPLAPVWARFDSLSVGPMVASREKNGTLAQFFEKGAAMTNGKRLSTEEKMEIFSQLVATQDAVANVRKSYEMVTEQYEISEAQLKAIEDEGLDNQWPPLSEPVSSAH